MNKAELIEAVADKTVANVSFLWEISIKSMEQKKAKKGTPPPR